MKLYIWNDPYRIRYGGAIAYAIAETEEHARELLKSAKISHFGLEPEAGGLDIGSLAPTRVLDLPCAEIYQWQE